MCVHLLLALRQELRLKLFEKEYYFNVTEEKIGVSRKLYNEKLHDLLLT